MAQIGLKYMVCAPLSEGGNGYDQGMVIARAIKADIKLTFNTVELWADDGKTDTIKEYKDGRITLEGDYLSFETRALLLGHEYKKGDNGQPDLLVSKIDDDGKYVGVGFYSTTRANGKSMYRAIWISKVKFSETGETLETKNGSTKYQTPSLEGEILQNDLSVWKEEALVAAPEKAVAWLNEKANIAGDSGVSEPGEE